MGARDGNAVGNRAAVSGTISGLSIAPGATFWIRWTDFNAAGADDGLAIDEFTLTPHGAVATQPSLSINDLTQAEGNAGTTNFAFTVTLDSPAGAGGVTFDIATSNGTAEAGSDYVAQSLTSQVIPAGSSSFPFTVQVNGDMSPKPRKNRLRHRHEHRRRDRRRRPGPRNDSERRLQPHAHPRHPGKRHDVAVCRPGGQNERHRHRPQEQRVLRPDA